jgi:hypothetical protein
MSTQSHSIAGPAIAASSLNKVGDSRTHFEGQPIKRVLGPIA